jgi:REP element-mobilizing transposase RayT
MTYPRYRLVTPDKPGFYHCVSRCVRRAFLCGVDHYTGQSFEHRRMWIERRLFVLAEIFTVSLYGYAVMSNHVHVVLLVDPIRAERLPDRTVAERWIRLFPRAKDTAAERAARIEALLLDSSRLHVLRRRLTSLSWFMRCLNEPIARRANAEDECTGRFWEGRFKCQALLNEQTLLAAMTYVDLNPIRAGITDRLERAEFTGLSRRLRELSRNPERRQERLVPLAGSSDPALGPSLTEGEYVELVDWTRAGSRSATRDAASIRAVALRRLGLSDARWRLQVGAVGCRYYRVLGSLSDLVEKAQMMGQHWLKGLGFARKLELI